ncbi:MAG: hypothetical protein WC342_08000 [Methanoregula sp.]
MQGYLRMYQGTKIPAWSRTPEESGATALFLNTRYEIDGRDPQLCRCFREFRDA